MQDLWKKFPKNIRDINKQFPTNTEQTLLVKTNNKGKQYHENPLGIYFGVINTPSDYRELSFKTVRYDMILEEFVPLYIYGGATADFYKKYISLLDSNLKMIEKGFNNYPPMYFSIEDIDEYIIIEDLNKCTVNSELNWTLNDNPKRFEFELCEGHKNTTILFQTDKGITPDWNINGIFFGYTWNPEETNINKTYLESFDWAPAMDDYRSIPTVVSKNSEFLNNLKNSNFYLEDIDKYIIIDKSKS